MSIMELDAHLLLDFPSIPRDPFENPSKPIILRDDILQSLRLDWTTSCQILMLMFKLVPFTPDGLCTLGDGVSLTLKQKTPRTKVDI